MAINQRKYPRIALQAFIRFYQEFSGSDSLPEYRKGVIKNYSTGGLFISTPHIFPTGSVLTVEIPIEPEEGKMTIVEVRGVVRWIRKGGFGIEFFEFKDNQETDFSSWIKNLIPF